ncbi:MAG: hypothetical protein WAM52_18145 [Steroidobacteraceae bacterium]
MDEVTNALIAGISAKVKLLAENAEARVGAIGESAAEDINEAVWTLAQAGQAAAEEAARRASRLTAWPAITLTVLLSATALCMAFIGGAYYGVSGRTAESAPPSALTAWALSPAGHEAYTLDKANAATGGIRMFTLCSMPGWRTLESQDRTLCMPYPLDAYEAKYQAWVLPRDPRPVPPKRP